MATRKVPDLSIYLVTDSSSFPTRASFLDHLRLALSSQSITVLQLREKKLSDEDFLHLAREVKAITTAAGVPLVINDNLYVCQQVQADGLHIGWDDVGESPLLSPSPHSQIY